ncbi:hypothetical protein TARUN_4589 [Trichoderma arundinaceum]|uniref:Uncharacterized protein n=1 Tax=Trichoderma arundinaceum TaxID=490622 RepID=A0A395NP08_TRIAR|nr:hypothetical protein TARUN_4589 [Trichoderma arundinaceum]
MDSYDDDIRRQQYHPSHSIPDAAYPDDSPFRQQQLQLQAPYGPGGFGASPAHPSTGISPLSSHMGSQPAYQSQHQPQPQHQGAWAPYDIPNSPPPPYDPSQAPSAYQYPQIDAATLATPATQPNARIDAHMQTGGIEMMPLQGAATAASPAQAPPPAPGASTSALTQASHAVEDPYKLDAAAAERRRKQRRLKLCIIVLAVIFIFFGALIIGVALGVVKGALNKPDHGPDF